MPNDKDTQHPFVLPFAVPGSEGDTLALVETAPGLSPTQRRFLALRLLHESDAATAKAAGVTAYTCARWKAAPVFAAAYEELMQAGVRGVVDFARSELQRLAAKTTQTISDLLDAEEEIPLRDGGTLRRPAWMARAKGAELNLRALRMWNPEPEQEPESEAARQLRRIADMFHEARERELAESQAQYAGRVVEGQTTVLPELPGR